MSIEELLKPRFEVIADYPNSNLKIGTILTKKDKYFEGTNKEGYNHILWNLEKHPHLFRPLQWFEKRKPEEMPKYLKHTLSDKLTTSNPKFIEWKWDDDDFGNFGMWSKGFNYMPCSEDEYLSNCNKA